MGAHICAVFKSIFKGWGNEAHIYAVFTGKDLSGEREVMLLMYFVWKPVSDQVKLKAGL